MDTVVVTLYHTFWVCVRSGCFNQITTNSNVCQKLWTVFPTPPSLWQWSRLKIMNVKKKSIFPTPPFLLQWNTVNAEIKVIFADSQQLERFCVEAWSRLEYSHAGVTCCLEFSLCSFIIFALAGHSFSLFFPTFFKYKVMCDVNSEWHFSLQFLWGLSCTLILPLWLNGG